MLLTLLHHLLPSVRPLNRPSLNLTAHQKPHETQIPRAHPETTALLGLRRCQGACISSSSQRFPTLPARSSPKDGMKKPASCGLREARDQHLDHPRAQQCVRPAQSVLLYEEDQHCGQRSSNTHPASAHQSGCLTPPSFSEAPLLLATTPKRHPGYRCHLMTSSCLVFSQDPSESPHVTRLCCFGPGHDLSRWQFPVLPPHKERLHLGLRGRRS